MNEKSKRLASLDLLRGTDIFFLTVLCGLFDKIDDIVALPKGFMEQLDHPAWVGFSVLDMVMPLFIFMCGAALPLALPKRLEPDGTAGRRYWGHVASRVALLWICGMISQGELMSFDLTRISFFNNTLQTIACGYVIAAVVMLLKGWTPRLVIAFALAFGYTVFLHACGNTASPTENAAVVYEVKFLSLFYPDAAMHPVKQIADWHYTWWPTIPMFGFMALAGAFSTVILKGASEPFRKLRVLVAGGVGLLALGGIFATFDPIVKHIFTASFTFLAMGVSVLLYALYYWVFDIVGIRRGTGLIALFGRHSLLAYMCADTTFRGVLWTVCAVFLCGPGRKHGTGLSRFFSDPVFGLVMCLSIAVLLCAVLYFWEQWKKYRAAEKRTNA